MTHRYLLHVLAEHNPQDMIFSKFSSIYQCMSCSANEHVKFISKMAKMDARSLINTEIPGFNSNNLKSMFDSVCTN